MAYPQQGHLQVTQDLNPSEEVEINLSPECDFFMGAYEFSRQPGTVYFDDGSSNSFWPYLKFVYYDGSTAKYANQDYNLDYGSSNRIPTKEIGGENVYTASKAVFYAESVYVGDKTITSITPATFQVSVYYFDMYPQAYIQGIYDANPEDMLFFGNDNVSGDYPDEVTNEFEVSMSADSVKGLIDDALIEAGELEESEEKFVYDLGNLSVEGLFAEWIGAYNYLPHKFATPIEITWGEVYDLGNVYNYISPLNTTISNAEDLFNLRYANAGKEYILGNDIDLNTFVLPSYLESGMFKESSRLEFELSETDTFCPIYNFYENYEDEYCIVLDGDGHEIKNFVFSAVDKDYIGLFRGLGWYYYWDSNAGSTIFTNCSIKNLTLNSVSVVGRWYVGGLIGYLQASGNGQWHLDNVRVINGDVTAEDESGGLYGYGGESTANNWGTNYLKMRECSYVGDLSGGDCTGGLAGGSSGTMLNCFARGNFENNSQVAGLCGDYWSAYEGEKVENCYFAGTLIGTGSTAPLIIDGGYNTDAIQNCYYDSDLIGIESFTYNHEQEQARTTEEMTYPYDLEVVYIDWEFAGVPEEDEFNFPSTVESSDSVAQIIEKTNDSYPELGGDAIWWPLSEPFFWFKMFSTWNSAIGYTKRDGTWMEIKKGSFKGSDVWN